MPSPNPDQEQRADKQNSEQGNSNTETQLSSDNNSNLNVDTTADSEAAKQALFMQALREKQQKIEQLEALVLERREAESNSNKDPWDSFTSNPRELIQKEIEKQVAPINQFISRLERNETLSKIKQHIRGLNPTYALVLDKADMYVDQVLGNSPVTVESVTAALNLVLGLIASGQIKGVSLASAPDNNNGNSAPPQPNRTQNREIPPNMPPSSNPISRPAGPEGKKPWEDLTETERRFARMSGLSDEDFWKSMHSDILVVNNQKKS